MRAPLSYLIIALVRSIFSNRTSAELVRAFVKGAYRIEHPVLMMNNVDKMKDFQSLFYDLMFMIRVICIQDNAGALRRVKRVRQKPLVRYYFIFFAFSLTQLFSPNNKRPFVGNLGKRQNYAQPIQV